MAEGRTFIGVLSSVATLKSALGMPIIHAVILADILQWIFSREHQRTGEEKFSPVLFLFSSFVITTRLPVL
jgi:hypothetical protein